MKKFQLALFFLLFSAMLLAQEETTLTDTDVVPENEAWYASPWLWVAGAALVIILLVVISNRRESRE